jgi:hypothetical protein
MLCSLARVLALSREFLNPTAKTGGGIFALFVIAEDAAAKT